MSSSQPRNIHATSIRLEKTGCLIRGASGSGKSLLALELLDRFGKKAALIADDRTLLTVENGRLFATCPPALKGKIELYGRGIIEWSTTARHAISVVIDLVDTRERMPLETAFSCTIMGVKLRRIPVPNHKFCDLSHQRLLVQAALRE